MSSPDTRPEGVGVMPNSDYVTPQCVAGQGVCPDTMLAGRSCADNVYNVSGGMDNMQQCVKFSRSLQAGECGALLPGHVRVCVCVCVCVC